MTMHDILARMSKSAEPNPLQKIRCSFRHLDRERKEKAIELILSGTRPDKAVKQVKRAN